MSTSARHILFWFRFSFTSLCATTTLTTGCHSTSFIFSIRFSVHHFTIVISIWSHFFGNIMNNLSTSRGDWNKLLSNVRHWTQPNWNVSISIYQYDIYLNIYKCHEIVYTWCFFTFWLLKSISNILMQKIIQRNVVWCLFSVFQHRLDAMTAAIHRCIFAVFPGTWKNPVEIEFHFVL